MKTLAIIGAGDLGQQLAHFALTDKHYDRVIFFDDFQTKNEVNTIPVRGKVDTVLSAYKNREFDELLIAIGYKHMLVRASLYERFKGLIPFGRIIHSTVWVDSTTQIKEGVVIYPNCTLDANVLIEENVLINIACSISHDTKVGSHCFLSPRVALAGFITIGEQCILGINSTVIDNIKIGPKIQLGGSTLVIKNIDKSGLYVGSPAKFIR